MKQLFSVAKVPLFCDQIGHKTEIRRGETVKVVVLNLRLAPIEKKLARAIAVPDLPDTLFGLNSGKPRPIRRAEFDPPRERQLLRVYAAPDTPEASIAFDQAKVGKLVTRMTKDRLAHDLQFSVAFGPCGKRELEFAQEWFGSRLFVSFDEAEPGLFDEPEKKAARLRRAARGENPSGEPLEFDTDADGKPMEDEAAEAADHTPVRKRTRHRTAKATLRSRRR